MERKRQLGFLNLHLPLFDLRPLYNSFFFFSLSTK
uniref:Uncharacterized protein n=1 Tax=Rhizophora mucronata TaxID=61149 RepID=A0A2P2MNN3_RHIMU